VVRVRAGQRRTLAAREPGLATIPVYVRQVTDGDEKTQVVERVAEQIVENDQRQALTDAQRVRGIQQMLDAGVPVTKVAKIHRLKYAPCIVARPSVSAEVQIPAGASC
jgi:ParB family chromosome partitioning protein